MVILFWLSVFRKKRPVVNFSDGVKKISLSYFQLATLASHMNIPWNKLFIGLFTFQNFATGSSMAFFSLDCTLATMTPWEVFCIKLYATLSFPLLIVPICYVSVRFCCKGGKDQFYSGITLLWYLAYPKIVALLSKLVSCTYSIDGNKYLKVDPTVICWHGDHLAVVWTVGLAGLTLYVIGLPLAGLIALRNVDRTSSESQLKFGILYDGYSKNHWWWEIIVVFRKIAIITISSWVEKTQQVLCAMFIVAMVMFLTSIYSPFNDKRLLNLELASLSLCFFTFWIGSMLLVDPKCSEEDGTWCFMAALSVIFLNIVGVFGLVIIFGTSKLKENSSKIVDGLSRIINKCCCCNTNGPIKKRKDSSLQMESLLG